MLQTSELPQPSPIVPQYWPPEAGLQVSGVQIPDAPLHRLSSQVHPLLLQVLPQSSELPQPSPMVPQYWSPFAVVQVNGVQTGGSPLHRLSLQVHPVLLQVVPQSSELPQPSPMIPQYWSPLAVVQSSGTQPAVGPALHRWSWHSQPALVQVAAQSTELPQPSPMVPQYWSPEVVVQVLARQPEVGPALHRPSTHAQPALGQVEPQSSVPPQPSPMAPQ